jgi:hypothetical protein
VRTHEQVGRLTTFPSHDKKEFDMSTWTAVLVGAALLSVFVMFLIQVRRIERDVDFGEFARGPRDDDENATTLWARIVANSIVASP